MTDYEEQRDIEERGRHREWAEHARNIENLESERNAILRESVPVSVKAADAMKAVAVFWVGMTVMVGWSVFQIIMSLLFPDPVLRGQVMYVMGIFLSKIFQYALVSLVLVAIPVPFCVTVYWCVRGIKRLIGGNQ